VLRSATGLAAPWALTIRNRLARSVANGRCGAGNKQSGYVFLVLPVSLCDTFMLAQVI
jgi:hypothetical protein